MLRKKANEEVWKRGCKEKLRQQMLKYSLNANVELFLLKTFAD